VRLAEAPSFGKPIVLYDVQSIGAQAYMAIANELIAREPEPARTAMSSHVTTSAAAGEARA
jgi:DNA-binding FadR family transcriptional regulator